MTEHQKFKVGDRVRLDEDDYRAPYAGTIVDALPDRDPGFGETGIPSTEPMYVVREVPDRERRYERISESALTLDTDPEALDLDDLEAVLAELAYTAGTGRPRSYCDEAHQKAHRRHLARVGRAVELLAKSGYTISKRATGAGT